MNWDNITLRPVDSELYMPIYLHISPWNQKKLRRIFATNNLQKRLIVYNPHSKRVRPWTSVFELHPNVESDFSTDAIEINNASLR